VTWGNVGVWGDIHEVVNKLSWLYCVGVQTMSVTPVTTAGAPDTKKAFEALAALNTLQDQLL
jgi:hypothetical protein